MMQLQNCIGALRSSQQVQFPAKTFEISRYPPTRKAVHCSASNSADHSAPASAQPFALSRRTLFSAAALSAALGAAPLPSRAENVIDGQGKTLVLPVNAEDDLTIPQRQILEYNKRTQRQNGAPPEFPLFVREGYDMIVMVPDGYEVSPEGLIYKDYAEGSGEFPQEGQQVTFDYTAYNESAALIDSSYRKGQPAQTRIGIQGLIPGFELGIRTMKPGGKRRIIVPPELGPPVGPSTFFSAKQWETFDVTLFSAKTCVRRTVGMFSDVVCE